jgi:hypothetical protein
MPISAANTASAWFSACTAPEASNHDVAFSDDADTTMSNINDALVGAAGMNER